ncbi:cytochrome c3 family protein [Muricoccus radiodurans]|uniref:cytochrome c3 family protein n=1 Tax=Muricoccus radiodurans TaxID=2231721 RepID=UPI003CF9A582
MPQLFSPRADARLRLAAVVGVGLVLAGVVTAALIARSGTRWAVGQAVSQPVPFSHAVHAGGLGLDCRFCHAGVERQASAGMPSAETCLSCHSRVWNVAAQFAPLRAAVALGTPVEWASVHRLPEHVRFHHGAHTAAGVGCNTCHGTVREMPRTVRAETLNMGWCLDCHRNPPARSEAALVGVGLRAQSYVHLGVEVSPLTRCSTCHR